MSNYPGYEQDQRMVNSFGALKVGGKNKAMLASMLIDLQGNIDEKQAIWEKATRERPYNAVWDRLVLTVWRTMYPDCPYFPNVDTMELASMRAKVFDIADAVFAALDKCDGGMGCFSHIEHFGVTHG